MRTPYSDPKELGLAIKRARLNAGLKQDVLAKEIGTTRKRIGNMEKGEVSTLGETPEQQYAAVAPIAAATGDLSLIGIGELDERIPEILSLQRDLAEVRAALQTLAGIVGQVHPSPTEELRRLQERLAAKNQPRPGEPGEDQGQ